MRADALFAHAVARTIGRTGATLGSYFGYRGPAELPAELVALETRTAVRHPPGREKEVGGSGGSHEPPGLFYRG